MDDFKDLQIAIKEEEVKSSKVIQNLKKEYAKKHTTYKPGDIVYDGETHRLEAIIGCYDYGVPKLIFRSTQLRKSDLTEMKNPKSFQVYEGNIEKIIKRR